MSGKQSRQRRVEAVKAAQKAVYEAKGLGENIKCPFDNERQARIFDDYVLKWLNIYWRHKYEKP